VLSRLEGHPATLGKAPTLIFTTELREKARGHLDGLSPLLLRWAGAQDAGTAQVREQIEQAAALVPESQRTRVLGPLTPRVRRTIRSKRPSVGCFSRR